MSQRVAGVNHLSPSSILLFVLLPLKKLTNSYLDVFIEFLILMFRMTNGFLFVINHGMRHVTKHTITTLVNLIENVVFRGKMFFVKQI